MSASTPVEHYLTLNRLATIARQVAGAAHEVNNALQVIGGSAELLQSDDGLPAPAQKTLSRIRDQANRAASAITGVVGLSRSQTDGVTQLDVREVASRAVELRRYSIGRADLAVRVQLPSAPQFVRGHRLQLLQAVLNLVHNAEQALAPQRAGTIQVEVADDGDHVALRVTDDGPGVPAVEAEQIFEPFVTSHPRPESTGLGLFVARHIAAAHGGSLELEPAAKGASFRLRLPKAQA